MAALTWEALQTRSSPPVDPDSGPCSSRATLRLFGQSPEQVRVTLFRDHHAWCPYCQKIWIWLEEKAVPYRVRKVTMHCYGTKEAWYRKLVPSGMLPALELDGRLLTESDRILQGLEEAFGPLGFELDSPDVWNLRRQERLLFRSWCQWLCSPGLSPRQEALAQDAFVRMAAVMEDSLMATPGPFLLERFSSADVVTIPYLERMGASLAYYKGFLLRKQFPAINRWFDALEQRSTYRGTQSDFHTHAHDLPPQMGGCQANGSNAQRILARRIDHGPWPITSPGGLDPETSQPERAAAASEALGRVLKHRTVLMERNPLPRTIFEPALRSALSVLIGEDPGQPPSGSAPGLRYLRDRISVPRDMSLHAARTLRQALEVTASLDPSGPTVQGPEIPTAHRRDQDPQPFLKARLAREGQSA